jgi:mxaJ protein
MSSRSEAALLAIVLAGTPAPAGMAAPSAVPDGRRVLRVCADPNNLPFSNARQEGFENRIAALAARELGADLRYTWAAQRRGFVRNTLGAGECDAVMGVPAGFERVSTTAAYYRSTYVFVSRRDLGLDVASFDDPRLRRLRVGVQMIGDDYANSPPAHALARRGIVDNVAGYSVYGDYTRPDPPRRIVDAVAAGSVDVAVVWGPLAGYFARAAAVPLRLTPVAPAVDPPALPFAFDIAMGVRRGDDALRKELDEVLVRRAGEIDSILRDYGVPRVSRPGSVARASVGR